MLLGIRFDTDCCDDLEPCGGTDYRPGLSGIKESRMPLLSSAAMLRLVDSMAILPSQAYQLARARLVSSGSPIPRLLAQRDQEATEVDLLRRDVGILRAQRGELPPRRRPNYEPERRLAIFQLRRLRGWSIQRRLGVRHWSRPHS